MPEALQLIAGYATLGAAGSAVATPSPGDTFTVPSFDLNSPAYLEQIWSSGATTDFVAMRSPRMHDNNQGIRLFTGIGDINPLIPFGCNQPLYPSDVPTVTVDNTAAASSGVAALYGYTNLPGVNPRLDSWATVQPRIKEISGVQVNLGACAAIGAYSAGNALNSLYDNFNAGSDYAILGYLTAASVLALAIQGQDTGNLKVGGPGVADPKVTSYWFVTLSEHSGRGYIPIIAANNKGSTNVYQVDSSAHAAQSVTLICAELG
jgi:hypothetical protein